MAKYIEQSAESRAELVAWIEAIGLDPMWVASDGLSVMRLWDGMWRVSYRQFVDKPHPLRHYDVREYEVESAYIVTDIPPPDPWRHAAP